MRTVASFLIVSLLTLPALGDSVQNIADLVTQYGSTWTEQASNTSTWTGGFDMDVVSSVYENADGRLAFVYEFTPVNTDGVFALNLEGDFSSAVDPAVLFSSGVGTPSFNFGANLSVFIGFGSDALDMNETLTVSFLVDPGTGFGLFSGNALDTGNSTGSAYAPTSVPEPGTLTLLGTGLLMGGLVSFRKRFQ